MTKLGKKRDKNFSKIVQGDWSLGHTIEELRENVYVGDTLLKDLKEEHLAVIWNDKVGSHYFRQAIKKEAVYRIANYFQTGYDKREKLTTKSKLAAAIHTPEPLDPKVQEYLDNLPKND